MSKFETFLPKVSIVIPVYNGEKYIRESIDSALGQTYSNIEILVVDDGSIDNTESIVKSYGDKVCYFKKENGGVASALNLAIQKMKGEYFSWLSHDDKYYPTKVEKQIEALRACGDMTRIIYSGWDRLVMPDGELVPVWREREYKDEALRTGVFPVIFNLINGITLLIHRSHFERVGLFREDLRNTQDYDMWFRMFRGQKIEFVQEHLAQYRCHDGQGQNTRKTEYLKDCDELQYKMLSNITKEEISSWFDDENEFWQYEMETAICNNWTKTYELCKKRSKWSQQPLDTGILAGEPVVLYGMGVNGIRIYDLLCELGLNLFCYSDSDSQKWGKQANGLMCKNIDLLDRNLLVIPTMDHPRNAIDYLRQKGFKRIVPYYRIAECVIGRNGKGEDDGIMGGP